MAPTFRFLAPALLGVALLSGCATNPATGQSDFVLMSEEQEIAIGREAQHEIAEEFGGRYDDDALQAYVQRIGEALAARSHRANLVYRFTVLDSDQVNAFALPGGYIYVTRGLLAYMNSEAELAAVLGHEIGHVTARHSVRQYTAAQAANMGVILGSILLPELRGAGTQNLIGVLGTAMLRGYGRDHELEADRLGAEYLARTGYAPGAMLDVIGVLKDQELFEIERARREERAPRVYHGVFSTHPSSDERLQEVVGSSAAYSSGGEARVAREEYLERIDGLVFGPGAREGVLRGRHFYHAGMDIALRFPRGWRIENRPDRLVAAPPSNDALLQVTATDINRRIDPRTFMVERLGLRGLSEGAPVDANTLPGYTAVARADSPFGPGPTRFTVIYFGDRAFLFAGAARDGEARYRDAFLDTATSLHALTPRERALATPRQLEIVRAGEDTTYAALAEDSGLASYAPEQLRLLNGDFPDGEPRPGQLVKVVR